MRHTDADKGRCNAADHIKLFALTCRGRKAASIQLERLRWQGHWFGKTPMTASPNSWAVRCHRFPKPKARDPALVERPIIYRPSSKYVPKTLTNSVVRGGFPTRFHKRVVPRLQDGKQASAVISEIDQNDISETRWSQVGDNIDRLFNSIDVPKPIHSRF